MGPELMVHRMRVERLVAVTENFTLRREPVLVEEFYPCRVSTMTPQVLKLVLGRVERPEWMVIGLGQPLQPGDVCTYAGREYILRLPRHDPDAGGWIGVLEGSA